MPRPRLIRWTSGGDAHVIHDAGGRASDDAIRSLVISHKLLGTREWFVIHQTDRGMGALTNDVMAALACNRDLCRENDFVLFFADLGSARDAYMKFP